MINPDQLKLLIPKASIWANEQEEKILKTGVSLSEVQINDARSINVKYPEKIRLLSVSQIPLPEDHELKFAAQAIQLITSNTIGLTLRYGIFIRNDFWNNRRLLIHEFMHTVQYERLGGVQQFLNQYLSDCIQYGYSNAPLELEAKNIANIVKK